ncbi:MAG: WXG100 family type VII secretion target [Clostridiales Family XIII bacterium]|jgi:WXG100 family type VII secretion target|nr:WXG100 family type VII secretion target [Clostridiales Family XIII bacterium]
MAQSRKIVVDTGDLRSTAQQLTQLATDYDGLYKEVLGKISDMSAQWEEIDSSTYRQQVEGFRDDFEKMKQEIDRYAEFLIKSAASYEQAQDTAVAQAKTLIN